MFSEGYGFVVDYLAEILRTLRNDDFSQQYADHFELLSDISTRDRDAVNKTFSGLMKILFPHREATVAEIEEILQFAIEGRKRIKDQLMRIDQTYETVRFGYRRAGQEESTLVQTIEEKQYPQHHHQDRPGEMEEEGLPHVQEEGELSNGSPSEARIPKEQHLVFQENRRGVSYDDLFGPHLKGAGKITITDPYIRLFYQTRNLMEFLETLAKLKSDDEEIEVHLLTVEDEFKGDRQKEYLMQMQESIWGAGIRFDWEFDKTNSLHARHIITDTGWKIILDRGLDIFQHYDMNQAFSINNRMQKYRSCKAFEITYLKEQAKP